MRVSDTFRPARRLAVKLAARAAGKQFTDFWRGSPLRFKDAVKLRPASPKPGKREVARRLRRAEANG